MEAKDTIAKDTIRRNKPTIQKILGSETSDFNYILDRVFQNDLIIEHELDNLKDIKSLVDKIMRKGEDTCKDFLNLLTDAEILRTFPDLKKIQWKAPLKRGLDDPKQDDGPVQNKRHMEEDQDKLTCNPTLCVNINTINILSRDAPSALQPDPSLKHSQTKHFSTPQKKMPPHDGGGNTVTGYLHCVTPIKMAKKSPQCKYFNALLQTGPDQFNHAVIFTPGKHTAFTKAQNDSTAVKLSRITKRLGFSGDSFEVEVSSRSDMVETTVPFKPNQPTNSAEMEIDKVLKLEPKKKIGILRAKVIDIKDDIKIVKFGGEDHEVKECCICDSTGRIKLELWNSLINNVKIDTSYEFSNISTRRKPEETQLYLTCTKDTRISTTANLEVPEHLMVNSVAEHLVSISGEISAICLNDKLRCSQPHCGKSQVVNTQFAFHKCEGCMLKQPVANFTSNVSGTIVMTTSIEKVNLTVPLSPLTAYLTSCNLVHLFQDTDKLENHFLETKYFDVSHCAGNILTRIQKTSTMAEETNGS